MKHALYALLLITSYTTYGMQEYALGPIEKHIFLNHVNAMGKPAVIQHINATPDPEMFYTKEPNGPIRTGFKSPSCFIIKTRINPKAQDLLSKLVAQKIDQQNEEGRALFNRDHGYLESYTEFSHVYEQDTLYIDLESNFTSKNALLHVLNNQ